MGDWGLADFLERQGIRDRRVLGAIRSLSRADFVPLGEEDSASRPMGQPYIVAYMTEALRLKGHEKVLEVGTGSAYQTAVLALLCQEVYTVESDTRLACSARRLLHRLGFENVYFHLGEGWKGWPREAPFDAIIATAAPAEVPMDLLAQLKRGGRMVLPVGPSETEQELVRVTRARKEGGAPQVDHLLPVSFVPMTGAPLHS